MTTKEERKDAEDKLREMLTPGARVYTILRHRSGSGMQRSISLVVVNPIDKSADRIDFWASRVMDYRIDRDNGGLVARGAGTARLQPGPVPVPRGLRLRRLGVSLQRSQQRTATMGRRRRAAAPQRRRLRLPSGVDVMKPTSVNDGRDWLTDAWPLPPSLERIRARVLAEVQQQQAAAGAHPFGTAAEVDIRDSFIR